MVSATASRQAMPGCSQVVHASRAHAHACVFRRSSKFLFKFFGADRGKPTFPFPFAHLRVRPRRPTRARQSPAGASGPRRESPAGASARVGSAVVRHVRMVEGEESDSCGRRGFCMAGLRRVPGSCQQARRVLAESRLQAPLHASGAGCWGLAPQRATVVRMPGSRQQARRVLAESRRQVPLHASVAGYG